MAYRDDWKKELRGHAELRSLHEELRREIRSRWNRSLPFADELFDRWERADHLGFGTGSSIYDSSVVIGDVSVGDETWIGPNTILDGSGGLSIGRFCSISAGVQIYTHDTVAWSLTGGAAGPRRAPVRIADFTYLGPGVVVQKGTRVGTRCVVGAGTLVNRDIPDHSIVFGLPGRVVGRTEVTDGEILLHFDDERGPTRGD
jgi:acetyltransferase-like isoleucine patch superfamily enzyme